MRITNWTNGIFGSVSITFAQNVCTLHSEIIYFKNKRREYEK